MAVTESPDITARRRAEAIDAMRTAEGQAQSVNPLGLRPQVPPPKPIPPIGMQAGRMATQAQSAPTNRSEVPTRTVISAIQDMAARDAKDYADLIQSLRDFAGQKRADLEQFERLLGTK